MSKNTTRPRLIWLHTHFLLNTGGTRFIYEVATRLKKHYHLEIFVERVSPDWRQKFSAAGIKVTPLLPLSSTSPLYWLTLPFWLRRSRMLLKSHIQPNDLVISSMFPMNYLANKLSTNHLQICYEPFAFFHDPQYVSSFPLLKRIFINFLSIFYRRLDISATHASKAVVTPNQGVAYWVEKIYQRKVAGYTYIGVDTKMFKPTSDKSLSRKFLNQKIILHSTDFTTLKGTDFLLKMLPYVQNKIKNFTVVITQTVNDPAGKAKLVSKAKSLGVDHHLYFTGSIPYADLPKYYSLADLYAFTGNPADKGSSSASLSVLESLSCQTPVVRSIGTPDEVIDGKTGYLVDPRQPKKFAQKIIYLLTHPAAAKKMGQAGRRRIQQNYTWDHVTQNIHHRLQHALN